MNTKNGFQNKLQCEEIMVNIEVLELGVPLTNYTMYAFKDDAVNSLSTPLNHHLGIFHFPHSF